MIFIFKTSLKVAFNKAQGVVIEGPSTNFFQSSKFHYSIRKGLQVILSVYPYPKTKTNTTHFDLLPKYCSKTYQRKHVTLADRLRTNFCTQIIKTAKQRGRNYTIWLKSWEIIDIGEHLLWCCIDQGSLKCWWVSWTVRPFSTWASPLRFHRRDE